MSGLYDIDKGQVSLDGQNISQLDEDIRFESLMFFYNHNNYLMVHYVTICSLVKMMMSFNVS